MGDSFLGAGALSVVGPQRGRLLLDLTVASRVAQDSVGSIPVWLLICSCYVD